ncbi:MAG TPA: hypothetical protein VFU50_08965 [Terriglobales bacterium]|nr:hypothetical protein [Terriglobales bacterium]
MPSIHMKEIRIPSTIMRESKPSVIYTIAKAIGTALLVSVISFFFLNACAIAGIAILGSIRGRRLDFAMAYRDFAAPAAIGIFVLALVGSMIFFFRERSR